MKYELKTNTHIAYTCHYHVVFCPKYRRKVLINGVDERLKTIILETIEKWGQECIELEVMPDHVHLLVGCDPQFGIHRLVKYIKGTSSRFLRQEFPHLKRRLPSLWTNSYFIATVGGVTLETLQRYVEGQKDR
jgi:putative transposase